MRYHTYGESEKYKLAVLVKSVAFNLPKMTEYYTVPLLSKGLQEEDIILSELKYAQNNKAPVSFIKEYLAELLPNLDAVGTEYLYCTDGAYFKVLTKSRKAEIHLGYTLPCKIPDYEHMKVILGVNYRTLMYNPVNESKLALSLTAVEGALKGQYSNLGVDIIEHAEYPSTLEDIASALESLHQYSYLSCDTETMSLDFDKAGVGTITFCWAQHEGVAFACDYKPINTKEDGTCGKMVPNIPVRALLRDFFSTYKGELRWHNSPYDFSVLIYNLWMDNLHDNENLLKALDTLTKNFHDTKIIAYLATNTTAGNELSLKDLAHEFAGNWAQADIKNICKIPLYDLLKYNLIDGLSTNYVYDKYYPIMVADNQEAIYKNLMLPSQKTITQMEMSGMALDPDAVLAAEKELTDLVDGYNQVFDNSPIIQAYTTVLQKERQAVANAKLKVKQHPLSHFSDEKFNPNSDPQLRALLYDHMGLPVLDKTKTKMAATGAKTIKKLVHHTSDPDALTVLDTLINYGTAEKILTSFIPAFKRAIEKGDDVVWLHGSFNLGGTVSGRLSSSNPNLQNIPSGSKYGKLIKKCFVAPKGWIFCGSDFDSLEDYISALTTKDPNKLKVYQEGYDGHCLRAFSYFKGEMPDIVDTVESINSIQNKYPEIRQKSKLPTFALTYQGTHITLQKSLGLAPHDALSIEANYHELYKVSDEWVADKLAEASKTGYVELAFGLRLRTPLLAKTFRGHRTTPREAEAEGRTAGNALGQSYGLLNNRAVNVFMEAVWASPYRYDIKPIALIHDAIYLLIKDRLEILDWVNRELIKAMQWQDLPELHHPTVKLGAKLEIYWPDWAHENKVPNKASLDTIRQICKDAVLNYKELT